MAFTRALLWILMRACTNLPVLLKYHINHTAIFPPYSVEYYVAKQRFPLSKTGIIRTQFWAQMQNATVRTGQTASVHIEWSASFTLTTASVHTDQTAFVHTDQIRSSINCRILSLRNLLLFGSGAFCVGAFRVNSSSQFTHTMQSSRFALISFQGDQT